MEHVSRAAWTYAEIGLLDGLQLVAELPWVSASNRWPDSALAWTTRGLGSLRAGLGAAAPIAVPVSLHAIGRFPLHRPPGGASLAPPLGEDQVDVDVVLAAGGSAPAGPWRVWGAAEGGVRVRTGLAFVRPVRVADFDEAGLYRLQLGVLPRVGGRDLGWVQVEAEGAADIGDERRSHALGLGTAAALARGLHLELGLARALAGDAQGWRWSAGISHIRRAPGAR